ncbi:MAG: hypothetical protein ACUVQV_01055 [Dissulfurimicrobium sp.]
MPHPSNKYMFNQQIRIPPYLAAPIEWPEMISVLLTGMMHPVLGNDGGIRKNGCP